MGLRKDGAVDGIRADRSAAAALEWMCRRVRGGRMGAKEGGVRCWAVGLGDGARGSTGEEGRNGG